MSSTSLVAVGVVIPVVLLLAYLTVAPRMERLRALVLVVLGLAYLSIMVVAFVPLPSVVECDLAPENIEVRSTARQGHLQGYFERLHIGPCALYFHHSTFVGDGSAGD